MVLNLSFTRLPTSAEDKFTPNLQFHEPGTKEDSGLVLSCLVNSLFKTVLPIRSSKFLFLFIGFGCRKLE